jgi:hypothetical protein
VFFQVGSFRLDSPQAWVIGCAVMFVIFFPLYLAARQQ